MHIRSEHRRLLGSIITGLLSISFLFIPLSGIIPLAQGTPGDWWNTSWAYRKTIIIDHSKVSGVQENLPILVDMTDTDLASHAKPDGGDIAFVDANTKLKLSHEIEYYDPDTSHLVAWVRNPSLSSIADTVFYMYYGNPVCESQQDPVAVWDSNYMLVQHLNEKSGSTCYDSTAKKNDGTVNGNMVLDATGKIDGAYTFDGATSFVQVPHSSSLAGFASGFTASFWLRLDDVSKRQSILQKYGTTGNQRGWMIEYRTDVGRALALLASSNGVSFDWWYTSFNPTIGTWYYVTVVWQSNTVPKFYVNGQQTSTVRTGTIPQIFSNSGAPLHVGKSTYQSGREFKGALDETCLSNVARSSAWILTCYNNQRAPYAFYSIGNEETQTFGAPIISDENPRNGATGVYTNPTLSVRVTDPNNDQMNIIFSTNASGAWKEIGRNNTVGDGVYSCIPKDMKDLGTQYYWSVSVTDGTVWTNKTYSCTTTMTILSSKWSVGGFPEGESGVLIADINKDGLEEVIKAGAGWVYALNSMNGSVLWRYSDSALSNMAKPQMSDLDGDGILEIVVNIAGGAMAIRSNNGTVYWKRSDIDGGNHWSSPVVADIDGYGHPTVFVASEDIDHGLDGLGRVSSLSYDGQLLHQIFAWRPCFGGLSLADADNDGHFELFMGDRSSGYGRGVRCFWAENLTVRWERPEVMCSSHSPMLADINKDGRLEVLAGQNGDFYVLDSRDGSIIHHGNDPNSFPIHFQPSVYDIDLDGNPEMLMADGHDATTDDIVIWDLTQWKEDGRVYVGKCYYGPKAADVTGDGIMELIASSYGGVYVFDKNFTLLAQATNLGPNTFATRLTYAVVQDMDGDGYNELVVSSFNGTIFAFDTPARRPNPRARTEVQHYSEQRLGAAEYVQLPGPAAPRILDTSPLDGETNVSITLSEISFRLNDFQKDLINYTAAVTPNVGSDAGVNVPNGRYWIPIDNLALDTTYTWTVNATDSTHWTNKTFRFTTGITTGWLDPNWSYRKTITINPTKVSADQTDVPVLIDITDINLAEKTQPNGNDFVFTDKRNVRFNHEIESYDNVTGHLTAWVRVPFVSSNIPTILYMYYGNPNCEHQQDPAAVWDSNYKMVQHLNEKSGFICYDSTANSSNGTINGNVVQGAMGEIDGAYALDGATGYVQVPHSNTLTGFTQAFTASFWLKLNDVTIKQQTILNKYDTLGNQRGWYIDYQNHQAYGRVLSFFASQDGATFRDWYASFSPTPGIWYYITVVWQTKSVPTFYINGALVPTINSGTMTSIFNNIGAPLDIGRCTYSSTRYLKGAIDEIRISNSARSANSVLTIYTNQKDPAAFCQIGSEEKVLHEPIVSEPHPEKDETEVPTTLTELSFELTDYRGDLMDYFVSTDPDIGDGNATGVSNGRYSVSVTGLEYNTTYTWNVNVTDGEDWTNKTYTFTTEHEILQLLVDSTFNDSVNSADLRANGPGQDWYESRNDYPTLLFLDQSNVAGDNSKKAGFTASSTRNAYLSQDFSSAQTSTFTVQWDIYIDSILRGSSSTYRAGQMMVCTNLHDPTPGRNSDDRFVYMAFSKPGGGTSGTMDLVAVGKTTIATGLNLKQWYTIKVVVNVSAGTYDVYVNGVFKATVNEYASTPLASVSYVSFAQWDDGAGAFYVDNVFAFVKE